MQKQWLDEQINEKKQKKQEELKENQCYDTQVLELNKIRGMVQDQFQDKKKNKFINLKEENIRLHEEKLEYEENQRNLKIQEEKREIEEVLRNGQKQQFF